jgi:DNA-binding MarR family transcriptional regulator
MVKNHNSPFLRKLYYLKTVKISGLFSEDISFREYVMLHLIAEIANETGSTDVWVSDIVKRVEVTPQAVSKFIHLFARKGYIKCFKNAKDRRSMGLRMTDRGKTVLTQTEEELNSFCKSVFNEFSEDELATMHELMKKLQIAVQTNYEKYKKK